IVNAVPIGGLRMIDDGEADDKIIAVMDKDEVYSSWRDISDVPKTVLDRLTHYFLTYKQLPGVDPKCEITHVYGREEAHEVIRRSKLDYEHKYGDLESALSLTLFEAFNFSQRQKGMLDAL
ncbi:MAG: inorganic diphosphatase, partial [Bacteroidota bacterium]